MRTFLVLFALPVALALAWSAVAQEVNALAGHPFTYDAVGWWAVAFSMGAQFVLRPSPGGAT